MSRHKKPTTIAKNKTDYFFWSDDEVSDLVLQWAKKHRLKEMKNTVWESKSIGGKRVSTLKNSNDESDSNIQVEDNQTN
ncbi:hypothetical protein P5673_014217 [Acropora cervicornis]|uniref:Uncharacterized protein n=1 Tax=Acropora cervicornis TaxID=6130 RepID=A0AAD9QKD4_ACRCE|nr:hypothetical protein P5673_014217 [Acropora cervicornis]